MVLGEVEETIYTYDDEGRQMQVRGSARVTLARSLRAR